jgi:hypothetical protein
LFRSETHAIPILASLASKRNYPAQGENWLALVPDSAIESSTNSRACHDK